MAAPESEDEAMTQEELQGSAASTVAFASAKPRNAFAELMAPKPKPSKDISHIPKAPRDKHFDGPRNALGIYTKNPGFHPASVVIYFNDNVTVIRDKYPKSSIHTLLLPRSPKHNLLHPFDAFEDPDFLAMVQTETRKLKELVAKELQRKFGRDSKADSAREAILNGDVEPGDEDDDDDGDAPLPPGRDWAAEIITGIHAHPSMNHLHVHVLSRDMHSPSLKHRSHYNSFNTPFLIDVDDFPLAEDDPRRHPGHEGYLKQDLICWRCGQKYGNRFQQLKGHLEREFSDWKQE